MTTEQLLSQCIVYASFETISLEIKDNVPKQTSRHMLSKNNQFITKSA